MQAHISAATATSSAPVDETRRRLVAASAGLMLAGMPAMAMAQKKYGPGASDKEIRIGSTQPLSGPASAYAILGNTQAGYFAMVNDLGGIRGRKVNMLQYDDAYSPPKTVEQTRRLVEQDEVLLIFGIIGTPTNAAVQKYLNGKGVPQFVTSGATKWGDPKNFPWTIGWQPTFRTEGFIYARYLAQNKPNAKIGVLYQNDDFGKDQLIAFKQAMGEKASSVVMELSYETTDPTVDSQMLKLKASGADTFLNFTTPKFGAQAIKKAAEIGWKPLQIVNYSSNSVGSVFKPAGLENCQGIVSAFFLKDPTDPRWKGDAAITRFKAFMAKYYAAGDSNNILNVHAYAFAMTLHKILEQCGDDLTRENVMRQAANLKNVEIDVFLPGIRVNTSPTDFFPVEQMQMSEFKGERWEAFGPVISAD